MVAPMDDFSAQLAAIADQAPAERYRRLTAPRPQCVARYHDAVQAITPAGAARVTPAGRTLAHVVGHIAEWERSIIQAVGAVIAGVWWLRLLAYRGYEAASS